MSVSWSVLLPLLVYVAEMSVVTLGTMRIIFVSRGLKSIASLLGFFEVTLWLFAIGQIMQNLNSVGCYLGFALGFMTGNYLGVLLEKRLAIGTLVIRIITSKDARPLVEGLRAAEYGVTCLSGQGGAGPVQVVFTVIKRKQLAGVLAIIQRFDARAFYSVEEVQETCQGIFPLGRGRARGVPQVLRVAHSTT